MKKLDLVQMENVQEAGWSWNSCQIGAATGCAIVGVTMGLVTLGLGTAFGFACSVAAAGSNVCNGKN